MQERGTRATPDNRGAAALERHRGAGPASPIPDAASRRRGRWSLEFEYYALAGWIVLVEEVVRRGSGEAHVLLMGLTDGRASAGWLDSLQSLTPLGWAVLVLFLFILLTRGPEDTDRDVALGRRWPMLGPALPLLSIYALVASAVQDAVVGVRHWPASGEPPWPGPAVPGIVRRTAAVPLALLGDAMFRAEIRHAGLLDASPLTDGLLSPQLLLTAVASALPFAMFVAGPRIAAGAVLAWPPWIVRFLLFFLATWVANARATA